jgi:hypothetical protein
MKVFRATFLHEIDCDYWGNNKKKLQAESYLNFHTLHKKYYPLIKEIREKAKKAGVKYIWHFYEPYIEITWYGTDAQAAIVYKIIEWALIRRNIKTKIEKPTGDGMADWFCNNVEEREFGGKRHALSAEFVALINEYEDAIVLGKGVNEQVKRTIHTICNPLGINYIDEAKICFSRGLVCVLFRFFNFKNAVWIYKNIFRQKY